MFILIVFAIGKILLPDLRKILINVFYDVYINALFKGHSISLEPASKVSFPCLMRLNLRPQMPPVWAHLHFDLDFSMLICYLIIKMLFV